MNGTGNMQGSCAVAVPAEPAPGKWQPIETAPTDGTPVLIAGGEVEWSNSMHGWVKAEGVTIAAYIKYDGWRGENCGGHDEYYYYKPSHWMPLPAPPEITQ